MIAGETSQGGSPEQAQLCTVRGEEAGRAGQRARWLADPAEVECAHPPRVRKPAASRASSTQRRCTGHSDLRPAGRGGGRPVSARFLQGTRLGARAARSARPARARRSRRPGAAGPDQRVRPHAWDRSTRPPGPCAPLRTNPLFQREARPARPPSHSIAGTGPGGRAGARGRGGGAGGAPRLGRRLARSAPGEASRSARGARGARSAARGARGQRRGRSAAAVAAGRPPASARRGPRACPPGRPRGSGASQPRARGRGAARPLVGTGKLTVTLAVHTAVNSEAWPCHHRPALAALCTAAAACLETF